MRTRALPFFLLLLGLTPSVFAASPQLDRISISQRSNGQGHVVRFHLDKRLAAFGEPHAVANRTFEVTLFGTTLGRRFRQDDPSGPISSVRTREENGNLVVRFDFEAEDLQTEVYRDGASTDLLLKLTPTGSNRASASTRAAGPASASAPAPDRADRWRVDTIVIDAGHGGKDPGATANGVREKDIVLPVARKLGAYLEQLGVRVVYTRSGDQFVELRERGRIANQAGGKLFVSIHANSARDRRAHGTETYFLGLHKSDDAESVMQRENEVIHFEDDPSFYDELDKSFQVRLKLAQSAFMRQSQTLAGEIQSQFQHRADRKNRGVKQAGFRVLYGASMPAVLVELGFVSHYAEARYLASDRGQDLLASGLFRAIRDYKESVERSMDLVSAK